ncbi:MAG: hypothetical protein IT328_05325 [Caldilineaceae bacterium]|nr:hypothetical protein [Caldilineaceae bacterium]
MSRDLLAGVASPLSSISSRVIVAGLHGIGLLLLALHIYVRTLPPTLEPIPTPSDAEAAWWGLWPVTYLAPFWFWLGVILVLAAMLWAWRLLLQTSPGSVAAESQPLPWLNAVSALLFIAFYLAPIAHTRWGDAYILSQAIAWPDAALRLTHSWQAPLDVFLHSQFWLAFGPQFGWQDAMPVYRLLSPLAGLLYLGVLLQFAADREFAPGWLTYGLLASLGLMQLFFGYVENYSFAAAGILAFLWLGRRVLQGRSPLWLAALVLGITNATHPSTIVLCPALLYLGVTTWRRGTASLLRVVVETALPPLIVAGGTLALMEAGGHGLAALFTTDRPGGSDASWFVPLWGTSTRWQAYTLLSWLHLRDLLNQMLLVAPVVLPSLLWIGLFARRGVDQEQSKTRNFLAAAALAHLLLIVIWNPDYGGQRDWDLFSLAWIPATLWLVSIARAKLDHAALAAGFVPLIVLQALHTAAWVYQNTLPWTWP